MLAKSCALLGVLVGLSAGATQTWYVDDDNYGKSGLDGRSEATAFGTIQDAVDNVPDGSTILVLPGTYDKGGKESGFMNRVYIDKKSLTLKSTGGAAVTKIVGAKDPDTLNDPLKRGNGPNAVRAIKVTGASETHQVIIQGFTVTKGAVKETSAAVDDNYGSAVYVSSESNRRYVTLVDCDITDNAGSRGLLYCGLYVRCFIHDNLLPNGKGTATWKGALVNCVVTRGSDGAAVVGGKAVNCTLLDFGDYSKSRACNKVGFGRIGSESSSFYNSILFYGGATDNTITYDHCLCRFEGDVTCKTSENCNLNANRFPCVSPMTDNYRLRENSEALGFGDAAIIGQQIDWMPEGVEAYVDFYGNPISKTGSIAVGAVQTTGRAKSGAVAFVGEEVTVNDTARNLVGSYLAEEELAYPVQWHVVPTVKPDSCLYGFSNSDLTGGWRFPQMDETLWLMPPPEGMDTSFGVVTTTSAIYVDPVSGRDESTGDEDVRGTSDRPFKSLQAAVSLAKSREKGNAYSVVYAAEGVYDQGGYFSTGASNRVYVSSFVRIKGAGAGHSVIKGHLDTESAEDWRCVDGRGLTSVRCAYLACGALQGFTLTEGRCSYADDKGGHTGDCAATRGGGVLCAGSEGSSTSTAFILDCVITNCIAVRGSPMYLGNVFRTLITDCTYGQVRYARLYSCVLRQQSADGRTDLAAGVESIIGGNNYLYQCTDFDLSDKGCFSATKSIPALNEISLASGASINDLSAKNLIGSVLYGYSSYGSGNYLRADPELVDAANGNYEVHGSSPALNCGVLTDDYWKTYSSDFNGKQLVFAGGTPLAGAFHQPLADRMAFEIVNPSNKGTVAPIGRQVVNAGDTLTVTATDGSRHIDGFVVDGEFVKGASYAFVVPTDRVIGKVEIRASYSTNWYVNANTDAAKGVVGNDANTGFTPDFPKLTLEKVMACDLASGDVVHAAPGVYDQGAMSSARVSVSAGITLIGDEGAEKTVIKGHCEPYSDTVKYGGGVPLRCVSLVRGATVTGFTLTGGSTAYTTTSTDSAAYVGAGVSASTPDLTAALPLVQDCIISNNFAVRGGGAYGGAFRNCKFIDNYSQQDGNATYRSFHENCLMDRNRGKADGQSLVRYPVALYNVTMTDRNISEDTQKPSKNFIYDGNTYAAPVYNCIVMGGFASGSRCASMMVSNCIFSSVATYDSAAEANWGIHVKKTTEELNLDDEGRPLPGSPAINFGFNAGVMRPTDIEGVQRIYDGTVDAGCYEYDVRGDLAATMGGGVEVTQASPDVTLAGGKVNVPDGATVAGVWPEKGGKARYAVPMTAVDGTLTGVFANEAAGVERSFAVTDGTKTQTFKLKDTTLDFVFGFKGVGHGELADFTQVVPGLMLLVR